ncbi:MAG: TatD family hydrolase [Planctomycetota bacterium]|jgi:TatD DNase family protein
MIDTHCHLTFPDYAGRVREVLSDARLAGVTGAITISTTTNDCLEALALAQGHESLWCSAGVHPLYSDRGTHVWENLRAVAMEPECVAWGELGLDNHYSKPARGTQHDVLDEQLDFIARCANDADMPIDMPFILHCREAFDDLIPVLRGTSFDPTRFVFHCFTGDADDARECLDFGAMISFTGVVTFSNAKEVQEAARIVPRDRIMVETDAPFLTPEPHRKIRTNEPKYTMDTARFLAELRGESWDEFHEAINRNTERFFGIQNVT